MKIALISNSLLLFFLFPFSSSFPFPFFLFFFLFFSTFPTSSTYLRVSEWEMGVSVGCGRA